MLVFQEDSLGNLRVFPEGVQTKGPRWSSLALSKGSQRMWVYAFKVFRSPVTALAARLFNESTWSSDGYGPFVSPIHQKVVPHDLHQQRYENHVQMTALTTSTNVSEGRRACPVNALLYSMRAFNRKAVIELSGNCSKISVN